MSPASVDRGPLCAPVNRLRSVTLVVPSGVADWRHGSPIGRRSTVVGSISYCRFHLGGLSSPQVTGFRPVGRRAWPGPHGTVGRFHPRHEDTPPYRTREVVAPS